MGSDRAEGLEDRERWSLGLWKLKEDDRSSAGLKGLLTDMARAVYKMARQTIPL